MKSSTAVFELKRLRDDIQGLDISVHQDIMEHLPKDNISRNANGVFFDICQIDEGSLEKIRGIVQYAKAMRGKLDDHDRRMFENAQQLVSGPVDTDTCPTATESEDKGDTQIFGATCDGEEAFCTRMETGCVTKPAKGVFIKK